MLRSVSRRISAISLVLLCAVCAFAQTKSRHFELNYSFTVRITDPGKPLDIWFPVAQSDQFRTSESAFQERRSSSKKQLRKSSATKCFMRTRTKPLSHITLPLSMTWFAWSILAAVSLKQPASDKDLQRFLLQADKLVPIVGKMVVVIDRLPLLAEPLHRALCASRGFGATDIRQDDRRPGAWPALRADLAVNGRCPPRPSPIRSASRSTCRSRARQISANSGLTAEA